jgi:predicted DNA-binding transcriptional regulator AlpA
MNDPLILRKDARKLYFADVHRSTLVRWEREGKLPPPIRISARVQGWRRSTLERFLSEREGSQS